tara:strand:+ start:808 stop:1050 length:243 start_codon:yes stop_codon:yes gene_type:complete
MAPASDAQKRASKKWRDANREQLKELQRIRVNNKYLNDPEWREKKKAYELERYHRNKVLKKKVQVLAPQGEKNEKNERVC